MTILINLRLHMGVWGYFHNGNFREFLH